MFKLSNEIQGLFHKLTYFCCEFSTEGTNIDLPNNEKKKMKKIQQSANSSKFMKGPFLCVCVRKVES